MPEAFDAYYKWLAIPPNEQPPNHYRLLGVRLFESDPEVIAVSADKQMAHIKTYQAGQHSALSQKILNEIAAAKICLLKADRKAAYDERLQEPTATIESKPLETVIFNTYPLTPDPPVDSIASAVARPGRSHETTPRRQLLALVAAAVSLCVAVLVYLIVGNPPENVKPVDQAAGESGPHAPPVVNKTDAKEADEVIAAIRASYPNMLADSRPIELLKYYNAGQFRRNAGGVTTLPDSYSGAPVAGSHGQIMLWGIYENLPPGNYLVIYRAQALSEIAGQNICFLDVCRGGNTIAQRRPSDSEIVRGQWRNIPIAMNLQAPTPVEFRLWPNSHKIAVDRVYVFLLH